MSKSGFVGKISKKYEEVKDQTIEVLRDNKEKLVESFTEFKEHGGQEEQSHTEKPDNTHIINTDEITKTDGDELKKSESTKKLLVTPVKTPNVNPANTTTTTNTTSTTTTTSVTNTTNNGNTPDTENISSKLFSKTPDKLSKTESGVFRKAPTKIFSDEKQTRLVIQRLIRISRLALKKDDSQDEINNKITDLLKQEIALPKARCEEWEKEIKDIRTQLLSKQELFTEESKQQILSHMGTKIEKPAYIISNSSPFLTLIKNLKLKNVDVSGDNSGETENATHSVIQDFEKKYNLLAANIKKKKDLAEGVINESAVFYKDLSSFVSSFDDYLFETLASQASVLLNNDNLDRLDSYLKVASTFGQSGCLRRRENRVKFKNDIATQAISGILPQIKNADLAHKVLFNRPIANHKITKEEVRTLINNKKSQNLIYFPTTESEAITDLENITKRLSTDENIKSLQILFNESTDKIHPATRWGVAKISRDNDHYIVDYADSLFSTDENDCPLDVNNLFMTNLGENTVINMRDEVYHKISLWDEYISGKDPQTFLPRELYGVVGAQWAVSNAGIDNHPLRYWEGKNPNALRHRSNRILLESYQFRKNDIALNHIDKDQKVKMLDADGRFKPEFIESLLNPPNQELPLNKLINESLEELTTYIHEYENSYWYKWNIFKEEYDNLIKDAKAIKTKLAGCKHNEELRTLYHGELFQKENKPDIKKLIQDLENSNSLPKLAKILQGIGSRIKTRLDPDVNHATIRDPQEFFTFYTDKLKNIVTNREVTPNEFSWMGQQWQIKNDIAINTEKHTIFDEVIGKLLKVLNTNRKEMDDDTKCTEMETIIENAKIEINNTRFAKPLFGKPFLMFQGSKAAHALNHLHEADKKDEKGEKVKAPVKTIPTPKHHAEYSAVWNSSNIGTTDDERNVNRFVKLLRHYAYPKQWIFSGWFMTGHWGRGHMDTVKIALKEFQQKKPANPKEILDYFYNILDWETTSPNGDLYKTLRFGAEQINEKLLLRLPDDEFEHKNKPDIPTKKRGIGKF